MRESEPEKAAQILTTIIASNKGSISPEESRDTVAGILGITTDEYITRIKNGEVKDQALLEYAASLRKNYKIGLLSNISSKGLDVRFNPGELDKYFDVVVVSGVISYAKPEAQAYEITADKLGVRLVECIMIDDREEYCAGASGVGMQAI